MQTTTVDELESQGFTEDVRAIKLIERPFIYPSLVAVGVFLFGFVQVVLKKSDLVWNLSLVVGSLGFIGLMLFCLYRSRPKSRHTGKPLLKYKNADPDPGVCLELIYVCPDSKTFSRRVYAVRGHAVTGVGV